MEDCDDPSSSISVYQYTGLRYLCHANPSLLWGGCVDCDGCEMGEVSSFMFAEPTPTSWDQVGGFCSDLIIVQLAV